MSAVLLKNQLANGRLQVRIAWGANLAADPATWSWTDVTSDVVQAGNSGVSISIGRANESSVAQPATCSLRLKNLTNAYTPANPTATNYPNVRLGTPVQVRVSLDAGSTWSVRFQGEAASWAPGWDAQGKFAYVALAASGITRRLGQGTKPIQSALYRYVTRTLNAANIYAYWPMEDGSQATSAALGLGSGSSLMLNTAAAFPLPQFAALSSVSGSAPLINMNNGTAMFGAIQGGTTSWSVQFVINFGSSSSADAHDRLISTTDSNGGFMDLFVVPSGGNWRLLYTPVGGGFVVLTTATFATTVNPFDGASHRVLLNWTNAGANINWSMVVDSVTVGSGTTAGTLGTPVRVDIGGDGTASFPFALGHILVSAQGLDILSAITGFAGETADARLTRLCSEQSVSLSLVGGPSNMNMGPQALDTFLNLLRECESADLGYLLDGLGPGLTYICRGSIYNEAAQLTINANSAQVPATPGPQPALDDQRLKNRVTVTRTNGSFITYEDTNGPLGTANLGVFDNRYVVNIYTDGPLHDVATWLVHVGTTDGMRYAQIPVDFTRASSLAPTWLGVIPTARVDQTNLSNQLTQHPAGTVSLLAEGWTEFLSATAWRAMISCSAFRPWEVFTIQDARLGRIETDSSFLTSSATSSATSLSVGNAVGPWDSGSVPFDVDVEGEQITVTAITGTAPQTFTVTRSVNGVVKAHNSNAVVKLWKPGVLAL